MSISGEKSGKGEYICNHCKQTVILNDKTDTLPPCPTCSKPNYTKS